MPAGVDFLGSGDGILSDGCNSVALDADIAHRVKFGFGVHDPAILDGNVTFLRIGNPGQKHEGS